MSECTNCGSFIDKPQQGPIFCDEDCSVEYWGEDAEPEPDDDKPMPETGDGYITDRTRGGYSVSFDEKFIGEFAEYDDAVAALRERMESSQYWPNNWFVNDHGNVELLIISATGCEYAGVGYV
jgi:hypothetical protein